MEGRLQELDHSNKELTDHKFRSEATIRELEVKLRSSEEVCGRRREGVGKRMGKRVRKIKEERVRERVRRLGKERGSQDGEGWSGMYA